MIRTLPKIEVTCTSSLQKERLFLMGFNANVMLSALLCGDSKTTPALYNAKFVARSR